MHGCDNSESLILPVTARDEEWQPTTQESMFNYVRLSDGGIDRLDNVRPEVNVLADIGQGLVPAQRVDFSAFKQHRTIREAIAATIPGMQDLADIDVAKKEFYIRNRIKHTPEFNTPDGRAHFVVNALPAAVTSGTRHPYTLMTVRSEGQFNSIIYEQQDTYRKTPHRWSVLMNAADMAAHGLKNEDVITVRSDTGVMRNPSVYAYGIPPGNLMAYYPEANVLVGQQIDRRSRTPAFKSVAVSIETT